MAQFREFLSDGTIGAVKFGMRPEDVERIWGPADDRSVQRRPTEHLRYGSLELVFKTVPGTDDARLVAAAIYFGRPNQPLPAGARFEDWTPTDATTEAEFRDFLGADAPKAHSKADGQSVHLVLDSGASAVFEDGRLHSVRYRRAGKSPGRKQVSVSLPEATLNELRARAERERISLQELIQRALSKAG